MDESKPKHDLQERKVYEEGLTCLANPPSAAIDVVFIHGFTGHPRQTWTYVGTSSSETGDGRFPTRKDDGEHRTKFRRILDSQSRREASPKSIFWPQDILPQTLPDARIFTYGYDSRIRHGLRAVGNNSTVYDLGNNLLLALEAARDSQPSRPLIFVAHSLGGILVKEALRRSKGYQTHLTHLRSVYDATAALLFFGTPHRGADPRALIHRVAEKVARAVGFSVNEQLVRSLMPDSERLTELRDEFDVMSRIKEWNLYSFQEQYGLKILNGNKVVEDTSSTFGDRINEICQQIGSNHMDMCRFKGSDDPQYEKVAGAFRRILRNSQAKQDLEPETRSSSRKKTSVTVAATEEVRRACLDSLSFQQIDARLQNIKRAHGRTCNWLFDREEYTKWLDDGLTSEHHGFLWITGKPGAGKSTIMKHALTKAQKESEEATTISFFFNARGSELEKSTLGMYRSLLSQLFGVVPLQDLVISKFLAKLQHCTAVVWHVQELEDLLLEAVESLGGQPLTIFIDALDECEEKEVRDMIEFLERLGEVATCSRNPLRICLSSRHYPHISIQHGISLVVERQDGHADDIAAYVQNKLRLKKSKNANEIKAEILQRATGVFLWVVLVVQLLNKAYDGGQMHALRQRLNEIPDELDALFEDILLRDNENRELTTLCLQWILFSQRALKRDELYWAILSSREPSELEMAKLTEIDHEMIDMFILSCSKGLAEVSKAKDKTVQFIHESVRDFFLTRNGLAKLQPNLGGNVEGLSHEALKLCCFRYIRSIHDEEIHTIVCQYISSFERRVELHILRYNHHPFIEYAIRNIFGHADIAAGYGISQTDFFQSFQSSADLCEYCSSILQLWIRWDTAFQRHAIRRYSLNASLVYIFAEKNFLNLLRLLLPTNADVESKGERYNSAIQAASAKGHLDAVELLIDRRANSKVIDGELGHSLIAAVEGNHESVIKALIASGADPNYENKCSRTPLHKAVWSGLESSVRLLLANPRIDPNCADRGRETPLLMAVCRKNEAIVRLLLARPEVNPNCEDFRGRTPIHTAIFDANDSVLRLLLDHPNIDPNYKPTISYLGAPKSPLSHAVFVRNNALFRYLLQPSISVGKLDSAGNRIQQSELAKLGRYDAIVRRLLAMPGVNALGAFDHEAMPWLETLISGDAAIAQRLQEYTDTGLDIRDFFGRTLLHIAASRGFLTVARAIIARSSGLVDLVDKAGQTPLLFAARSGHEAIVKLLLTIPGVKPDCPDMRHDTPLLLAAESGEEAIVRLLLEVPGVDPNHQNKLGHTPLFAAIGQGHEAVAQVLLTVPGVDPSHQDINGQTPIFSAARLGRTAIVKNLLGISAVNPNHQDKNGRTPLYQAACSGSGATVQELLTAPGADPHHKSHDGSTPISVAKAWGPYDVIEVLLEFGAGSS